MSGTTYYQRSKDVILNRAKNYYENNKERFREQAKINIKTYLKNNKTKKKRKYGKSRYIIVWLRKKTKTKRISKIMSKNLSRGKKVPI